MMETNDELHDNCMKFFTKYSLEPTPADKPMKTFEEMVGDALRFYFEMGIIMEKERMILLLEKKKKITKKDVEDMVMDGLFDRIKKESRDAVMGSDDCNVYENKTGLKGLKTILSVNANILWYYHMDKKKEKEG